MIFAKFTQILPIFILKSQKRALLRIFIDPLVPISKKKTFKK